MVDAFGLVHFSSTQTRNGPQCALRHEVMLTASGGCAVIAHLSFPPSRTDRHNRTAPGSQLANSRVWCAIIAHLSMPPANRIATTAPRLVRPWQTA